MSKINNFNDYTEKYNNNADYSYLFNNMQSTSAGGTFSLGDYAAIKNGSYKKLLKAYYAKQDAEKSAVSEDSMKNSALVKSGADALKKSANALNNDKLWEKNEDYDWDAITKAVKNFVDDYNDVVEIAGNSDSKDVLKNAVWMTGLVDTNSNLLSKIGINVGKGNQMELDEEMIKKSDINTLKTLFSGHNSLADKIATKANSIANAAARTSGTYRNNGTYSNILAELASSKVDEEV